MKNIKKLIKAVRLAKDSPRELLKEFNIRFTYLTNRYLGYYKKGISFS